MLNQIVLCQLTKCIVELPNTEYLQNYADSFAYFMAYTMCPLERTALYVHVLNLQILPSRQLAEDQQLMGHMA